MSAALTAVHVDLVAVGTGAVRNGPQRIRTALVEREAHQITRGPCLLYVSKLVWN